jgi:HTH-type transcriptional regulator / antitoxin HigA
VTGQMPNEPARTNYAVAPGAYLAEWLDEYGISRQRTANLLGRGLLGMPWLDDFLAARVPLTASAATRLESVTGIPAGTWLRYESTYRADLARLRGGATPAPHDSGAHE